MFRSADRIRVVIAATLIVLLTAACSGDDDAAETSVAVDPPPTLPTTSNSSTTSTPTVEASTTTSTIAPATTTSTTISTSTTPPTTAAPTTEPADSTSTTLPEGVPPRVTFPDDPDLQAVVDAYYRYYDALTAVLRDPTDGEALESVLQASMGEQAERVEVFVERLVADGQAARPSEDRQPGYTDVVARTVFVLDDSATLDVCTVDTDVLVEVGTGAGGVDEIIDDSFSSAFDTYSFQRADEGWTVSNIVRVDRFEEQIGCG